MMIAQDLSNVSAIAPNMSRQGVQDAAIAAAIRAKFGHAKVQAGAWSRRRL
jgi:hypothetical protein